MVLPRDNKAVSFADVTADGVLGEWDGAVDVVVTNPGTAPGTLTGGYTYVVPVLAVQASAGNGTVNESGTQRS